MTDRTTTTLLGPDLLRRLERLAILAKQAQAGRTKGERRSRRKGSSVEFADYRDYVQGDDLRHIDWNVYGRLDALYLKLFQEQEDLTVHLLVDASASMSFGTPSKLDLACRLAAAIGYVALAGYDRVVAEAVGGAEMVRLEPCRGKASARRLFAFIESIAAGGPLNLEQACRDYAIRNRVRGVAVLLSDFLDPSGFEPALRRLMQSGAEVHAVHILAPEELDPDVSGDLRLVDAESGAYTEISVTPGLIKRYKANVEAFRETVRQHCVARGIGYSFAPSNASLEHLALDVMRAGGLLR